MDKNLEHCTLGRFEVAPVLPQNGAQEPPSAVGSPSTGRVPGHEHSGPGLPPTRAARASRGRGVFLGGSVNIRSARRSRWVEALVAFVALAVAAGALAVCVNAPSMVAGATFSTNPGPAIIAAASVAPPFVQPAKLR